MGHGAFAGPVRVKCRWSQRESRPSAKKKIRTVEEGAKYAGKEKPQQELWGAGGSLSKMETTLSENKITAIYFGDLNWLVFCDF